MIRETMTFWIDGGPALDAAAELLALVAGLGRRHGDRFRRLERDIEAYIDAEDWAGMTVEDLGEGHLAVTAPAGVTALLQRGRELGVVGIP